MKKFKLALLYFFGLPKSIYVCLRLCRFADAIRLPIIVSHKTRLSSLSGKVDFGVVRPGIVRIGFGSVETFDFVSDITILHVTGSVYFSGKAKIGKGSRLSLQGSAIFGDKFHISAGATLISRERIVFGDCCLVAWGAVISDSDHHFVLDMNGNIKNFPSAIGFGNRVWIGAHAMVLKGVVISDDSVIGAKSLVTGKFLDSHVLIAGNPAQVIKRNISWK